MGHHGFDDEDWLAFRYIAAELSPGERAAFEQQLAESQAAREAVARAVELTQALVAAGPEVYAVSRPPAAGGGQRRWRRATRWAAGLAASLLLIVAVFSFGRSFVGTGASRPAETGFSAFDLAVIWSQTRGVLPADAAARWLPATEAELAAEPVATEEPDEVVAPDWLLAAVSVADEAARQATATAP